MGDRKAEGKMEQFSNMKEWTVTFPKIAKELCSVWITPYILALQIVLPQVLDNNIYFIGK